MVTFRVRTPFVYGAKRTPMGYYMKHLDELNLLIDKASRIAGSDYKLAQLSGHTRSQISDWRHGRKPCPPEDQALIGAVAGLNAGQIALRALVEKHEGTPKGDRLMRVLGKALLVTGGTVVSAGANAAAIFSSIPAPTHALEWCLAASYTMCRRLKLVMTIPVMSTR